MSGRDLIIGAGGKPGGSGDHTPVEDPDSLRSKQFARVLDAVCEGEIEGFADPAHPLRCVYVDDTPIENSDGSVNFQGVTLLSRNGSAAQASIPGFQGAESEFAVGLEVKSTTPIVRTISAAGVSAVRVTIGFPQLVRVDVDTGDTHGTSVTVAIDVQTAGGGYVERELFTVTGKCTTLYQRAYRIELSGAGPWDVRVRKVTADSTSATLTNVVQWSSYTEIIDARLRYPNTALVALEIDSSQFRNIPRRAYDLKLLRVQVPVNYDPLTRVYTGAWDGTFKIAWTDNPAWCFYDLATNHRYGLGEFLTAAQVDKWTLYAIGQYCDQLVDDGFGGQEPRFTCNLYLQSQDEAFTVLNNLASLFRGMLYWITGSITLVTDAPADPIYQFNQSNVTGGMFRYSGSSRRARHTTALVAWNDPADQYRQKLEYVEDQAGLARYGIVPVEFTALGCASRGQAHRAGSWLLATERLETETVTFQCGLEGVQVYPGAIVQVHDPARAQVRLGGRVLSATVDDLVLDTSPFEITPGSVEVCCLLPDGTLETRPLPSTVTTTAKIVPPFSQAPVPGASWIITVLTTGAWANIGGCVVTSMPADGGFAVEKVSEDSSNGTHQVMRSASFSFGIPNKVSWRAKAAGRTRFYSYTSTTTNPPDGAGVGFDLSNGTIFGFWGGAVGTITDDGDGWYLCSFTFTASGTGNCFLQLTSGSSSYQGDGVSGILVARMFASAIEPTLWRIVNIAEAGPHLYDITAVSHAAAKFAEFEEGIILEAPPTANLPTETYLPAPSALAWREVNVTTPIGIERRVELSWTAPAVPLGHVRDYVVEWSFENGITYRAEHVVGTLYQMPASAGTFRANVYAVGPIGAMSAKATSTYTVQDTSPIAGFRVTGLELFGQGNDTVFLGVDATFAWRYNSPTTSPDLGSEPYGADSGFVPPTFKDFEIRVHDLPSGNVIRVEHTTDPHWTYTLAENTEDHDGQPVRAFRLSVAVRDNFNNVSERALLDVSNPEPTPPTGIVVYSGQALLNVGYTPDSSPDYRGIAIYGATTSGFTPSGANLLYRGSDATATIPGLIASVAYYLRVASFDPFGIGATDPVEYMGTPAAEPGDVHSLIDAFNAVLTDPLQNDKLIFASDAFAIQDPDDASHFPFGVVQLPGGEWVTVLQSDVLITGNVSIANLSTGALPSDVTMSLGGGTIVLDGAGSISVFRALGAHQDFVFLNAGDITFKKYVAGIGYVDYKSLRRIEAGTASSGSTVNIPGYWEAQPRVMVAPAVSPLFRAAYSTQNQLLRCQANNLVETAVGSMQWRFDAVATLELEAATGQVQINASSGDLSVDNFTSGSYTTAANCTGIVVNIQTRSKRGNGASQWNYRQYRLRVDYKANGTGVWTTGTLGSWVAVGAVIDSYVTGQRAVTFPGAGTWDFRVFFEWSDAGGVFGAISYQFSQETLVGTNLGEICRSTANNNLSDSDNAAKGGLPASTLNPSWEIYQITYNYQYDLTQSSSIAQFPSGLYYGDMSEQLYCRGTLKDSNSYANLSATSVPQKNNVLGAHVYAGSFLAHDQNPIQAFTSCTSYNNAGVNAVATLDSLSATIFRRTPIASSTTPVNTAVVAFYDYTLASAQILQSGSLNWIALGT